ncbi:MAG: hypothetical protein Q8O34_14705 [Rhodocyclaceae bacterium]|nr:hypothetical protein [Rhodocyclaceae bacterium]
MKQRVTREERDLLRMEWQAALSGIDEAEIVGDILARVRRMEGTVGQLRELIEAMPASPSAPPLPLPATTRPPAGDADDLPWALIAAGTVAAFLALLWATRRRREPAAKVVPVAPSSAPSSETLPSPAAEEPSPIAALHVDTAAEPPPPVAPPAALGPTLFSENIDSGTDQTIELAEVMLSMGLNQGAAQTLIDHIHKHPRRALYHWLMLLDVYRRSGMKNEFEHSMCELKQNFNIQATDWQKGPDAPAQGSIEDYVHITERIQELWHKPACTEYLERLLEDNRGGTRAGFPQPVAEEILLLIDILGETETGGPAGS